MKRYQELQEKYKDKPEFVNSKYGDPFDGEKVSQLTTSFAPESESESDAEDQVILVKSYFLPKISKNVSPLKFFNSLKCCFHSTGSPGIQGPVCP